MPADESSMTGKQPLKWGRIFLSGALSGPISLGIVFLGANYLDNRGIKDFESILALFYLVAAFFPLVVVIASVLVCLMVRDRRLVHSILASITSIVFTVVIIGIVNLLFPSLVS